MGNYYVQTRTNQLTVEEINYFFKQTKLIIRPATKYVVLTVNFDAKNEICFHYSNADSQKDINISAEEFRKLLKIHTISEELAYLETAKLIKAFEES